MKFFDLTKQYRKIKKEIDLSISRVLDSGIFIGGEEVEGLEKEIARYCSAKHAISLNSGTDALFLSLKSLGIGTGDEVITTPFTFMATAGAIINAGAKPVFADIKSGTFNINPVEIQAKITKKTKAIIPVHLFGQMADMERIIEIARRYKLFVIEDAAQAIGAKCQMAANKWQMAGTIGDCGCFSFFPTKNLGAYGDGGMVVTNNKKLSEKIRLMKSHGSLPKDKYRHLIIGTNTRLDSIQAAVLRIKLKHLPDWNYKRRNIAKSYWESLKDINEITIPKDANNTISVFNQFTVRAQQRSKLKGYLEKHDIPTVIYYPIPLHLQPTLKLLGYKRGDFPVAEQAAREVLSLPIYPEMDREKQKIIIDAIRRFYRPTN